MSQTCSIQAEGRPETGSLTVSAVKDWSQLVVGLGHLKKCLVSATCCQYRFCAYLSRQNGFGRHTKIVWSIAKPTVHAVPFALRNFTTSTTGGSLNSDFMIYLFRLCYVLQRVKPKSKA
eukprot:1991161-Pleurochrysis_carterae.AAC.8